MAGNTIADPVQLAEVHGRNVGWQPVALSASEWPDEGAEGSINIFREAEYGMAHYLLAERGLGDRLSDPPAYSLWRMKKDESEWRFLGHFDHWPDQWKKSGLNNA